MNPRAIIGAITPRQRREIVQALSHEEHYCERYRRGILFALEMEHMLHIEVGNYREIASEFERHQLRNPREDGQYMGVDGVKAFITDPEVLGRLHFGEVCQEVLRREISVREAVTPEWLPHPVVPDGLRSAQDALAAVQTRYQEEVERLAKASLVQKLGSRSA